MTNKSKKRMYVNNKYMYIVYPVNKSMIYFSSVLKTSENIYILLTVYKWGKIRTFWFYTNNFSSGRVTVMSELSKSFTWILDYLFPKIMLIRKEWKISRNINFEKKGMSMPTIRFCASDHMYFVWYMWAYWIVSNNGKMNGRCRWYINMKYNVYTVKTALV